jgi:hypothetical protein
VTKSAELCSSSFSNHPTLGNVGIKNSGMSTVYKLRVKLNKQILYKINKEIPLYTSVIGFKINILVILFPQIKTNGTMIR